MATEVTAGSTLADGTEQTLVSRTSIDNYQLAIDLNAMANGDVLVIKVKTRARAADSTNRIAYMGTYSNVQLFPIVYTIPVCATYAEFTIQQTAGTNRTYTWGLHGL